MKTFRIRTLNKHIIIIEESKFYLLDRSMPGETKERRYYLISDTDGRDYQITRRVFDRLLELSGRVLSIG